MRRVRRWAAAALLLVAAAIHLAVTGEHFREWFAAGVFFLLLGAAQLLLAGAVLRLDPGWPAPAAVAVSLGSVVLWVVSRTTGLPFGPEAGMPEPVGLMDAAASLAEALTVGLLWSGATAGRGRRTRPAGRTRARPRGA
jgi:hypothetical protein